MSRVAYELIEDVTGQTLKALFDGPLAGQKPKAQLAELKKMGKGALDELTPQNVWHAARSLNWRNKPKTKRGRPAKAMGTKRENTEKTTRKATKTAQRATTQSLPDNKDDQATLGVQFECRKCGETWMEGHDLSEYLFHSDGHPDVNVIARKCRGVCATINRQLVALYKWKGRTYRKADVVGKQGISCGNFVDEDLNFLANPHNVPCENQPDTEAISAAISQA